MKFTMCIIDPRTPEVVRSSYGFLPYLFYSSAKEEGVNVIILEEYTKETPIPGADLYLIALWSYPQIPMCKELSRSLSSVQFIGYAPFITSNNLKLSAANSDTDLIRKGLLWAPKYYDDFTTFTTDSDMHLAKYEGCWGTVYPLFSSYGCPNKCAFCPASANAPKTICLEPSEFEKSLEMGKNYGVDKFHINDEDLFFSPNRAKELLNIMAKSGCEFICLATGNKLLKFVEKFGPKVIEDSGLKVIEIGFETGDIELSEKMNKPKPGTALEIAETEIGADIFWLTLTFFPGETIQTLNTTGAFLQKYGYQIDEVWPRISTNSTVGGLGQFFVAYLGTEGYKKVNERYDRDSEEWKLYGGYNLSQYPIRLQPSFVPNSFLDSTFTKIREVTEEDTRWLKLYNITDSSLNVEEATPRELLPLSKTITNTKEYDKISKELIKLAVFARLGVIQ